MTVVMSLSPINILIINSNITSIIGMGKQLYQTTNLFAIPNKLSYDYEAWMQRNETVGTYIKVYRVSSMKQRQEMRRYILKFIGYL